MGEDDRKNVYGTLTYEETLPQYPLWFPVSKSSFRTALKSFIKPELRIVIICEFQLVHETNSLYMGQ